VYCRLYPVELLEPPAAVAARVAALARAYPYVARWLPCNEPNIEWPGIGWDTINAWLIDVFYHVQWYRTAAAPPVACRLAFPPWAPDAPLHHTDGWEACREAVGLYLDHGHGLAWHDYHVPDAPLRMLEHEMPDWLRARLPFVPTLIHECGRTPDAPADFGALGPELIARISSSSAPVL
jgi:hypothetical protein